MCINCFKTGKHEERSDTYGFVSRELRRRVAIPKGVNPESVTSTLTPDGHLTIMAPKLILESGKCKLIRIYLIRVAIESNYLIETKLQERTSVSFLLLWHLLLDLLLISQPSNHPKLLKTVKNDSVV